MSTTKTAWSMFMKGVIIVMFVSAIILAVTWFDHAEAQDLTPATKLSLVPTWTWGPSAAVTRAAQNGNELYSNDLMSGGLGVQINANFVDSRNFPWIGASLPVYMRGSSSDDSFAISPGLMVTLVGNFSVGASYDLYNSKAGIATGVMTGTSSWKDNGAFLFAVTMPWSGGSNAAIYTAGR